MRTKVTDEGLLIPKEMLEGIDEVDIRQEQGVLIIVPAPRSPDPIFELGTQPVADDVQDASINHDYYVYGH